MPETLQRFTTALGVEDRAHLLEDPGWLPLTAETVLRVDGSVVRLDALDDLFRDVAERRERGEWDDDRATSDRWLAPRVHWALRLTRAQAAEPTTWTWLALRYADYTRWRWDGIRGVTEDRWSGAINKQALARLWWGAEIFRDGSDYGPAARAFVLQDLINSLLHRTVVRNRPLALGLVDHAVPLDHEVPRLAEDVNAVANAVNLATSGAPPEAETFLHADDILGYLAWAASDAPSPDSWTPMPSGPICTGPDGPSRARARAIVERCEQWATAATIAKGGRAAQRLARRLAREATTAAAERAPSDSAGFPDRQPRSSSAT